MHDGSLFAIGRLRPIGVSKVVDVQARFEGLARPGRPGELKRDTK